MYSYFGPVNIETILYNENEQYIVSYFYFMTKVVMQGFLWQCRNPHNICSVLCLPKPTLSMIHVSRRGHGRGHGRGQSKISWVTFTGGREYFIIVSESHHWSEHTEEYW